MIRMFAGAIAPGSLLLVAAIAALPTAALARDLAPGMEARTVNVAFADLDLGKPAGKRALNARINRAIDQVCGNDPRGIGWADALRCRMDARADARAQMERAVARVDAAGRVASADR